MNSEITAGPAKGIIVRAMKTGLGRDIAALCLKVL